jgi:protein O-GlcNAc transferase
MSWLRKVFARTPPVPPEVALPAPVALAPPIDAAAALREGNEHVEAGRLDDAQRSFRAALASDATSVAARINLAFVLLSIGGADEAVPLLVEAAKLAPDNADAHFMLGSEYLRQGQTAQARVHLARTIELQPSLVWAYPPLCQAELELGDSAQALLVATRGLQQAPDLPELHHYLGNVQLVRGAFELAAQSYGQALRRRSQYAPVRVGLARAFAGLGRLADAHAELRQALADGPADGSSWCILGDGFRDLGLLDEALACYHQARRLEPDAARVHGSLGTLEQLRGNLAGSVQAYEQAVAADPSSAQAHCNLGTTYLALRRYHDVEACVDRALAIDPLHAAAHSLRGVLHIGRGEFDRALPAFERSIALDGQNLEYRSNLLFSLTYTGELVRYLAAAREFGAVVDRLATPFRDWRVEAGRDLPVQPLRVGLVSGDLRSHPVGYFIENVLVQLHGSGIDLIGFPTSHHSDELTERLKARLAGWFPIHGMADASAAHLIRNSGVHALIDLAGHTAHNRLGLFAWRPAPLQISWLGYFASTGVSQIDYVLADDLVVSDDSPEQFTERVWRLPQTRLCFSEPARRETYPVSALPVTQRGHLTLSCFQNFNKINDRVVTTWGAIFRGIPTARLLLQSSQSGEVQSSDAMLRRLAAAGIDASRVTITPPADRAEYLRAYANVDFALDTFPFPGGTTTCEALWMGVPTLTLRGKTMLERQGAGLMTCAGLPDWVAVDEHDYVRRALSLAADTARLTATRQSLRDRVLGSPLFDATRFAKHLADAIHGMWAAAPQRPA